MFYFLSVFTVVFNQTNNVTKIKIKTSKIRIVQYTYILNVKKDAPTVGLT